MIIEFEVDKKSRRFDVKNVLIKYADSLILVEERVFSCKDEMCLSSGSSDDLLLIPGGRDEIIVRTRPEELL